MSLAPELVPVLAQFPVVALVFAGAWVVLKWADRRHAAELAREHARADAADRRATAEVERVRADAAGVREADRRVIDWLEGELTRLRARNTQLQNQLDAGRGADPRGAS